MRGACPAAAAPAPSGGTSVGFGHAQHLPPRPGGIRQRAQDVEDGAEADLAADRRDVAHRGMIRRREHEAEPRLDRRSARRRPAADPAARPALRARRRCRTCWRRRGCRAWPRAGPAPATTNAAAVEMLNVPASSPAGAAGIHRIHAVGQVHAQPVRRMPRANARRSRRPSRLSSAAPSAMPPSARASPGRS